MRDKSEFIDKQIQTFNAIKNYIADNKIPPTIRELGEILEIKSTSTVWEHIKQLKTDGYISMTDSSNRSIRLEKDFYKITGLRVCGMEMVAGEMHSSEVEELIIENRKLNSENLRLKIIISEFRNAIENMQIT